MKLCEECGTPLAGKQKQFCSISCRNKPNGRKTGGYNKLGLERTCEECGKPFSVTPSRLALYNVRACSRACLGKIQSRERTGQLRPELGIQTYRRARKDACERCAATEKLIVHHKDENRYNNELSNLETLCRRCHQVHHGCYANLPRPTGRPLPPQRCEWCEDIFYRRTPQRCCSRSCARAQDHWKRRIARELAEMNVVFVD